MAGSVSDDKVPPLGREMSVGDIDRDPLFALRREPIEQQGEVKLPALSSHYLRVALERLQLIREQRPCLVQQPPDQRALAIIDAPAHHETHKRPRLVRTDVAVHIRCRGPSRRPRLLRPAVLYCYPRPSHRSQLYRAAA